MEILYISLLMQVYYAVAEIRDSLIVNKLAKVRPVGALVGKTFLPLTEIPPPHVPYPPVTVGKPDESARRHLDDCYKKVPGIEVHDGPQVNIFADYYDDNVGAKTVATVIWPDHIDAKHFEVTTQVPYLTVGPIEAIGYHPSTIRSEHPSECEKIYQDHLDDQYTEESKDYSEESLEMARLPLMANALPKSLEERLEQMYSDLEI